MTRFTHAALAAGLIVLAWPGLTARAEEAPHAPPAEKAPAAAEKAPETGDAAAAAADKKAPAAKKDKAAAPAPAAAPGDEDPRDRRIRELEDLVRRLNTRVDQLEKVSPPTTPPTPPTPEAAVPTPEAGPVPAQAASATLLPNISVIGNLHFAGGDQGFTEHRGRFFLDEFEVGIQDAVAPGLRYDAFITAGGPDFGLSIEEAYLTASHLGPGLTARAGVMHIPFGKFNPLHSHQWLYTDEPAVIRALLGPGQLIGDGAVLEYLLPVKGMFARAEVGRWETFAGFDDGMGFNGGGNGAWSGRVYLGKELSRSKELEVGFSRYQGRGKNGIDAGPNQDLAVNGFDVTYLSFPGQSRRILLQGEFITHDTGEFAGSKTRLGGYLTAAYRMSQFWEAGIRGDYTQYPFPIKGHETGVSLFLTKFITEQTALRVQLTHGSAPGFSDYNQIMLQLLFGSGPHSHNLQ
jgi:hypothetical protein